MTTHGSEGVGEAEIERRLDARNLLRKLSRPMGSRAW
jgi:hypothetical protein